MSIIAGYGSNTCYNASDAMKESNLTFDDWASTATFGETVQGELQQMWLVNQYFASGVLEGMALSIEDEDKMPDMVTCAIKMASNNDGWVQCDQERC
eukprot:scaffold42714_cov67-Attheya_sp.AAC.4